VIYIHLLRFYERYREIISVFKASGIIRPWRDDQAWYNVGASLEEKCLLILNRCAYNLNAPEGLAQACLAGLNGAVIDIERGNCGG